QPNQPWTMRMLSSSGGNLESLVQANGAEANTEPTWAPDGKSIVFCKVDGTGRSAIYRLELETRKLSPIPGSVGLFSPRLSPDGRYISALTDDMTKLMLFDLKTNHWSSLADAGWLGYTEWSHDGKYVYFRGRFRDTAEVVRARAKDGALAQVLSLK